jgi:hypothetical protein
MKMNAALVKQTLDQLEEQTTLRNIQAVPESNPAVPQLNKVFGEHTFFLASDGLHIVEPAETAPAGTPMGKVVKLASWRDANQTSLAPHKPQPTDIVVILGDTEKDEPQSA